MPGIFLSINKNNSSVSLMKVDDGRTDKILVPVFHKKGKTGGKRLLVTAGADGDEYAGIEAAYRLIDEFQKGNFYGELTVIPILNIPGFQKVTSCNPLDGKFPKNVYPGYGNGTSTERLIYWLQNTYITQADFWVDLHGGAINEILVPHIYFYGTGNKHIDQITEKIIHRIDASYKVYKKPGTWQKAIELSKNNVGYILAEADFSGGRSKASINMHIRWTKTVMSVLGMITYQKVPKDHGILYKNTDSYFSGVSGLWRTNLNIHKEIKKGQIIGQVFDLKGKTVQKIITKNPGRFLWGREGLSCLKGDTLAVLASE